MQFLKGLLGFMVLIFGILGAYPLIEDEITIADHTFEVTDNWDEQGELLGMQSFNGYIHPETANDGTWSSRIITEQSSRVLNLTYDADMRGGTGTITVNAYENSSTSTPTETFTEEMTSGVNEVTFEQAEGYDYFGIEVYMEETANTADDRPRLNSIEAVFEAEIGISLADLLLVVSILLGFLIMARKF